MTPSTKGRSKWNRVNGFWSLSLGSRGTRIRLFENRLNGIYYRDVWVDGKKDRRSLGTRSRVEAAKLGKLLLSRLLSGKAEESSPILTLGALWSRYQTECSAWLDNTARSQKDDERSAKILIAYFGERRDVSTLTENDQVRFQNTRLKGGISLTDGSITGEVRARSVQADLVLLHSMLRWATRWRAWGGSHLLSSNPLDGVRIPREKNDLRPIATWERFDLTRKAIADQLSNSTDAKEKAHWFKIDLALAIAEGTGRRIGSIAQLRWEDIDLARSEIQWRAEADKKGKEWVVPMGDVLSVELRQARNRLGAIAGWVFPSAKNPLEPMDSFQFNYWLRRAEDVAGVPKLKGGLWHPYRRKWATERKELPIKDVMAVGGWTDTGTFLNSYQQSDRQTQRRVMNEPRKLMEMGELRGAEESTASGS